MIDKTKKLKVYLDTSVVSYLFQEDTPEKMSETRELWEAFTKGEYEVCLSTITMDEIRKCSEPKRSRMEEEVAKLNPSVLEFTNEADDIAKSLISHKFLKKSSRDDARHTAIAIVNNCNCILSWNFRHIVNIKTINGVRVITTLSGYKSIEIWQPSVLLKDEEEDN